MDGFGGKGKKGGKGGDMWDMMSMMMAMMGGKGGKGGGGKDMGKMGKAAQKIAKGEKAYWGTLRYFNAEKNSGTIFSKEVMNEHGQEVFAFRTVLDECGAGLGDDIAFFLHWNERGQVQCSSPSLRLTSTEENNLVMKGWFKKPNGKDFGFIDSWECREMFGRDVYVAANLCEGLTEGQTVAFNVFLNKEGMPNAQMICACEDNYTPQPGDLSYTGEVPVKGKGFGKGMKGKDPEMLAVMASMGMPMGMMGSAMKGKLGFKGGGKGGPYGGGFGKGKGGGGGGGKKPVGTGQFMTGTVKSFNAEKNYGFISSEEVQTMYGGDCFCGGNELSNYAPGTSVMFQLALSDQGKPQAIDVTPC